MEQPQAFPLVGICLCTYQGQKFLAKQLDSLLSQTYPNFHVWVSDDGSTDDTLKILEEYRVRMGKGRFVICRGPGKGFVANFFSILCNEKMQADYYAFCDQDDIWQPDKLKRSVDRLKSISAPALYGARTQLVDEKEREIGLSPLFSKPLGFANALVQSYAGGNTMLMNRAAREVMCRVMAKADPLKIISHDWWSYIVISGVGGRVLYDPVPGLLYRQHVGNLIGSNVGILDRLSRLRLLLKGRFKEWTDRHMELLLPFADSLSPENRTLLDTFIKKRRTWFLPRIFWFASGHVYRQTQAGYLGLLAAAILKKV